MCKILVRSKLSLYSLWNFTEKLRIVFMKSIEEELQRTISLTSFVRFFTLIRSAFLAAATSSQTTIQTRMCCLSDRSWPNIYTIRTGSKRLCLLSNRTFVWLLRALRQTVLPPVEGVVKSSALFPKWTLKDMVRPNSERTYTRSDGWKDVLNDRFSSHSGGFQFLILLDSQNQIFPMLVLHAEEANTTRSTCFTDRPPAFIFLTEIQQSFGHLILGFNVPISPALVLFLLRSHRFSCKLCTIFESSKRIRIFPDNQ